MSIVMTFSAPIYSERVSAFRGHEGVPDLPRGRLIGEENVGWQVPLSRRGVCQVPRAAKAARSV